MDNTNQKSHKTIAVQKKVQFYTESLNRSTLAPGLYKMSGVRVGSDVEPGYLPVEISNDEPLDIDSSVSEILKEFEDFFNRRDIFKKMGFAHKRGYMLHGPPGCGKSSTLRLLEKRFVETFEGIVLFWNNGSGVADYYDHIREHEKTRPIMLVCEDIDSFVENFEESILEFLDGQKGLDNLLLIATTNDLEKIPSRIKDRPSRIDRVLEIGKPTLETRFNYLRQVGVNEVVARDLAERTQDLSIAQLKEIVVATVCLGQDLPDVLARLKVADMSPLDIQIDDNSEPDWD